MDKRTERTIERIGKAFIELIIESEDAGFTIKEVAGKADINRKTFYLHFNCIEDLYNELEKKTEKKLIEILEEKGFFEENFSLRILLDGLMELIEVNPALYEKLLVDDKYKFVFRNLKERIKKNIVSRYVKDIESLETEMQMEYVFSGLIKLFRVWTKRKDEMSKEKMYETAYKIIKFGVKDMKLQPTEIS